MYIGTNFILNMQVINKFYYKNKNLGIKSPKDNN